MSQHCPDKVPFAMRRRMGDQAPSGHSDPPSRIWHRGSAPASGAAAVPGTVGPVTRGGGGLMGPRSRFWAGQGREIPEDYLCPCWFLALWGIVCLTRSS